MELVREREKEKGRSGVVKEGGKKRGLVVGLRKIARGVNGVVWWCVLCLCNGRPGSEWFISLLKCVLMVVLFS